jgi:hypothetical protein
MKKELFYLFVILIALINSKLLVYEQISINYKEDCSGITVGTIYSINDSCTPMSCVSNHGHGYSSICTTDLSIQYQGPGSNYINKYDNCENKTPKWGITLLMPPGKLYYYIEGNQCYSNYPNGSFKWGGNNTIATFTSFFDNQCKKVDKKYSGTQKECKNGIEIQYGTWVNYILYLREMAAKMLNLCFQSL